MGRPGAGRRPVIVSLVVMMLLALSASCGAPGPPSTTAPTGATGSTGAMGVTGAEIAGTQAVGDLAFLGPARRLAVNGIDVAYRQFGQGPPLVLIVGQDSTMSYWGPDLLRALAQHDQVTIFDNRGVGLSSDRPDEALTIETMSDDTAALIEALGLDHPEVFGWSTGGEIALALAVRHPGQVGRLAVSGATSGGPDTVPATPELEAALRSTDPADEVKLLDALFTPSGAAARQRYIDGLLTMPAETVSPEISRRQAEAETAFAATTAVADGLGGVDLPTLVTNGADDHLVPAANARTIAAHVPGSTLVLVADGAHAWMLQYIDRFVAMLVAFGNGQAVS
ncbi:MAG TPA: alpha/beta hydrolase [Acidimicrobiales bacterium]